MHTAKKTGAGTDSNVFLNIFGSQGDTGERPLMFSKTNRNKFEKGNVSGYVLTSEQFLHMILCVNACSSYLRPQNVGS